MSNNRLINRELFEYLFSKILCELYFGRYKYIKGVKR